MRPRNDPYAAILQRITQSDPRAQQAMQMIQGKNAKQLRAMAQNMAKERGINLEEFARSITSNLPI